MMIFLQHTPKIAAPTLSDRVLSSTGKDKDVNDMYLTRINDLESELLQSQENLQSTIEELETSNEELQSTNEELLASNEVTERRIKCNALLGIAVYE
jgi:Skp family chaperone for outer membrane proteins